MENTTRRPALADHLAEKHKCSGVYVRDILYKGSTPTKGVGLRVLRDIQRIYCEPITKSEFE